MKDCENYMWMKRENGLASPLSGSLLDEEVLNDFDSADIEI